MKKGTLWGSAYPRVVSLTAVASPGNKVVSLGSLRKGKRVGTEGRQATLSLASWCLWHFDKFPSGLVLSSFLGNHCACCCSCLPG